MQIDTQNPRFLWGAEAIAKATGQTRHSIYHLFGKGQIPGAIKIGGTIVLDLDAFRAAFRGGGTNATA